MNIPIVEGEIQKAVDLQGVAYYDIGCRHTTGGIAFAFANTFSPADQVVVIRKSDYDALTEKVTHLERCLKEDKPWLVK